MGERGGRPAGQVAAFASAAAAWHPSRNPYGVACAVYLASWLALCSPWLFGSITLPYDAKAHFQAQIQFLANALHSGQSPFWSPNTFVGTPHIADPQSLIFSPAWILAYLDATPSLRQLDAYVMVLLALAGLAIIAMFRDRGWHPAGAVLAALAIAFGASAAWRIQHIGQIQSYAFFCISIWLLDKALRSRTKTWGALAGVSTGAMLAEPNQVGLLGAYVLAGQVIGHWFEGGFSAQRWRASLPGLATAGSVTLLIAGLPVLLAALYLLSSNRPAVAFEEAARGSLHPASLLTVVVGDLFGALDPNVDYWGPYSWSWNPRELTLSQNMSQLYLGALPAILLLTIGLSRRLLWEREVRVFAVAAAFCLLFALGTYTPAYAAIYKLVPGVAFFRRPADATFILGAMLAILSGYFAHRWLSPGLPDPNRGWRTGKVVVVGLAFALAIVISTMEQKLALAQKPLVLAAMWLAVSVVVFRSVRRRALSHPFAAVTVTAVLMSADLYANNGPNESTAVRADVYEVLHPKCKNETIGFLKQRVRRSAGSPWRDRVELLGLGFEWPNVAQIHGLESTLGYNPLRMDIVSKAIGAGDHIAGPDQRNFTPLFPSYKSLMANMLGLRFIASAVPIETVDTQLPRGAMKLVARTGQAYIYENADVLPRVMLVGRVMPVTFAQLIADGRWPDFNPADTVLLDRDDASMWTIPDEMQTGDASGANVSIVRYENTVVEVDVSVAAPRFLVLNDLWHPWWSAFVGDMQVPILKANIMFRAVYVPAGTHRVRFEFAPFAGALAELRGKAIHD